MNCRSCNTPIPSRSSSCPNCGRSTGVGESFIDDPGDSGVEASEEPSALGPSTALDVSLDASLDEPAEIEEELSLDDAVASVAESPRPASKAAPPAKRKKKTAPSAEVPFSAKNEPRPAAKAAKSAKAAKKRAAKAPVVKPAAPVVSPKQSPKVSMTGTATLPDPEVVRAILAENPELLEPGLEIFTDDAGQEIGVQHFTDVGVIDLLATDADGCLVAVIVASPTSGSDLVGEALHRVGWVRKHLAKNGEDVRGIVLTDHFDDQLAYAAAAVSGTIRFKNYALSLALTDLDL